MFPGYLILQKNAHASIFACTGQLTTSATTSNPLTLWALALGLFGEGVTEFVPVGLLPQISTEFGVSIPMAGWVVSTYAASVLVGAPLMTMIGVRVPRKLMLVLLMVLFTVGNLVSALAPTFDIVLIGRVVTSFSHGAFFGIGSIVAAELACPARRSAAVAFMFSGLAVANLVGVPLGTWLGDTAGWRATFLAIAVLGVATVIALLVLVPYLPRVAGAQLRKEFRALGDVQVILPPLQTVLLDRAAAAPTLASAINIGAFNFGNAIAAWLGGLTISAGLVRPQQTSWEHS